MFSKKRQNSVPYLDQLSTKAKGQARVGEIKAAIAEKGFWEDFVEWRMSTVTELRIDLVQRDGKPWFRVRVACDHEMICYCQTIERAVEFLCVYERLIADLFWTLGWPSWAEADRLEP
jgi:hypothetical protein